MKKIICLVMFFFVSATLMAEQMTLDRLIVEINGKSYSQKHLETYILLRTIAMGEEPRRALPSAENWAEHIEQFKNEMIVYTQLENDPQKLESFAPDSKRVQDAESILTSLQSKNSELDKFIRQRQLSEANISEILTMVFRVEAYVKSRLQLAAARSQDESAFTRLDPTADWFLALAKATPYRFFAKAKDYVALMPFRT
ncbi:MAG: hypothetical protein EOP07_22725 [Proteobacteria bacterium]|nr:MAG: hypothetical protein EOP07_22725 [Pseudomonadota bacterium]